MHRGLLFGVLLSFIAAPGIAATPGNYLEAMQAYKAKDYETCAVGLKQLIADSPAPFTTPYYNAACCLAMAGHLDEAMVYLQKAVAHPAFREFSTLSQDPDLMRLHANPGWPALVQEAEAKSRLGPVMGAGLDIGYARKHPPKLSRHEVVLRSQSHPVVLLVVIEPDGSAGDIKVEQSSGNPGLDRKAIETAKGWRYLPATSNGETFRMQTRIPFDFGAY